MKRKNKERKIYYYKDLENDDFGNIILDDYDVPKDYKYERKGIFAFFSNCLYYGAAMPVLKTYLTCTGLKVHNKENVKKYYKLCKEKNSGGFIYGNHVSNTDAFFVQTKVVCRKRVNVIANPNSLSKKILGFVVKTLGIIPLSKTLDSQKNFLNGVKHYIKDKKEHIVIFPEAHEWPYCTFIRPFKKGSFHYPVKFDTPILPICTTFIKTKDGKKPKKHVYVLEPIVIDLTKTPIENKTYLENYCFTKMKEMSEKVEQYEYIIYKKKEEEK